MRKYLIFLIACLLVGWSLGARAVPTPVACDPDATFYMGWLTVQIPVQPVAGQTYSGLVHPRARVGFLKQDGLNLAIAMDSDSPTARRFDVLRFDFTGAGKFDNAHTVRLIYSDAQTATSGTTGMNVLRNNVTYPVKVTGYFSQDDTNATLHL